jgi:hypothetical protein
MHFRREAFMSTQNPKMSRRTLFAGAGTVGAVAAATSMLPSVQNIAPQLLQKAKPERGGGYELSEHVKRYYKTTLV